MAFTAFDGFPNLVTLFFTRAAEKGDAPFLWAKADGRWHPTSWAEAARQVAALAQTLTGMGLVPGDRVLLVSENRPEWCIADLGIMAAGCITVPTYTTNTERDHQHILTNSGARAVIVSTEKLAAMLLPAVIRSEAAEHVITMEDLRGYGSGGLTVSRWADATGNGDMALVEAMAAAAAAIGRDDLACIIYTSGTGGAPRGVMQHHGAIMHNVSGAAQVIAEDFGWGDEVFLSFLPLSHAYEHSGGQYLPIGLGGQIYYAESLEKLAANIEEVRPTIMFVVPRLFEVLRQRMLKQVGKQGKVAPWLLGRALAIGARRAAGRASVADLPMRLILSRTILPKVQAKFGGRIKALVSGGAPLNPDVGIFFDALGLTLLQGYGQTEAGPIVSCNRPSVGIKMDTVGPPLPRTEVRVAEDGELMIRGELVMQGYWQNQAETDRVLKDGWLASGDIGHIDAAGRIVITDRKKDLIINDKGDNIAPQRVEGMLTLQPEILQAMIYGDRKPHIVALVVPDPEWALDWARAQDMSYDFKALQDNPQFRVAVRAAIDRVNADLSVIERIRRFDFADEAFAIDNEEMTPSMKIRRHIIRARYAERLDALYGAG